MITEASIPPQPTQSLADTAAVVAGPGPDDLGDPGDMADLGGTADLGDLDDLDDLVIEDLTGASWPAVAPRICICTFSGE